MRLCFGRWWQTLDCPGCQDSRACAEDFTFCRVALVAQASSAGTPLRALAGMLDVSVEVVRFALAYVLDGVEPAIAPLPAPPEGAWWKIRTYPPGTRGTAVAKIVWDPRGNYSRWLRERKRHPQLRRLSPGFVIERAFAGEVHQVVVPEGWGYLYRGVRYPTLYAVQAEICGRRALPRSRKQQGSIRRQPSSTSIESFLHVRKMVKDLDRFAGRIAR